MVNEIELTTRLNGSNIRKMIFKKSINEDGIEIQLSNPSLTYSGSMYRIETDELKQLIKFLNDLIKED